MLRYVITNLLIFLFQFEKLPNKILIAICRGQREGGVSENASYYVFVHAPGKAIEAIPIKEWYNFIPRVNYRTLDAEEAEEKFAQRGKILNLWALNINKKLKPGNKLVNRILKWAV